MISFLTIAERIYDKFEEDKLFSKNRIEHLNRLMSMIQQEIKDTPCKLKYNFIDFEECLTKPSQECAVKLDISLMPTCQYKGEYIMWLATFIERITVGGKPKFPPLSSIVPSSLKIPKGKKLLSKLREQPMEERAQFIVNYFQSTDYIKNNKLPF